MIDFAELREFEELKLKNYSSGMHVRLAFSVAIQVDADILLIDEVLAVGDAGFKQKCFDVFHEMRDAGKTIVFVTHGMAPLNQFCHRAMLLERGVMLHLGEPQDIGDRYLEINFGREPERGRGDERRRRRRRGADRGRVGRGRARRAGDGGRAGPADHAARAGAVPASTSRIRWAACTCSTRISRGRRRRSTRQQERSGRFRAGDEVVFSFTFENILAPGRYSPVFNVAHRGTGLDLMARFEGNFSFVVTGPAHRGPGGRSSGRDDRGRRDRRAAPEAIA